MSHASNKAASEYWNRRMKREPAAPTLDELILELNRRLRADQTYVSGTRFILRQDEMGEIFPTWEGPAQARPLVNRILQSVTRQVTLPVPFRIDG